MILLTKKRFIFLYCFYILSFIPNVYASSIKLSSENISSLISFSQKKFEELDSHSSLSNAHKALQYAYEIDNNILKAGAYNVIAKNYSEILEAERAITIFYKAYDLIKETEEVKLKFDILNHLAVLYKNEDATESINLFFKALSLNTNQIPVHEVLLCKVNIVYTYYKLKDFEKGYGYLRSVEQEILHSESALLLMHYHILSANYYDFKRDSTNTGIHYNLALKFVTSSAYIPQRDKHLINVYYDLSIFYKGNNDKEKSYYFLKQYLDKRNSLHASGYYQAIINYASKIDEEEFERHIIEIAGLNNEQKDIIFYNRLIYSLFLLISIVLFVTVLFLIKNQQQKIRLISKIRAQNRALNQTKKDIEKETDLKTQFIGKVSHELRTPLYSVIGLTHLLEQDYTFLRNNKIITGLKSSSDYLMNLINDLLQLQKIEANADKVEFKNYTINCEIDKIKNSYKEIAASYNDVIEIIYDNYFCKVVKTDKVKLNKIITNLLSNALRYTRDGKITIRINQEKIDDNTLNLQIIICDTGADVIARQQEMLLIDANTISSDEINIVDKGLRLPVVKKLIHLLGGEISVTNELNKGLAFHFNLPCEISEKSRFEVTSDLITHYKLNDLSILLVENNEINRIVNQRVFKNHNIACTAVASAKEALDLLDEMNYDVILTDISMPEMDGFEFTQYLRDKGLEIPIIALTAYNKSDIIDKVNICGLSDVVTKPFDFDFLLTTIHSCLQQTKKSLV
jgi:signal transduction histidine kinase/ActR/RegA family two-component response regulator